MPTLTIEGRKVKVDDSFLSLSPEEQNATVDEIARSLGVGAQMQEVQQPPAAPVEPAPQQPAYGDGAFRAATEGSQAGLMFGFDDEIGAGMMAPIHAGMDWMKGEGFSIPKAYTRLQQQLDERKGARRAEHPVASIAGEVAGGLATGAGASKAGLTLAGKTVPGIASVMPRTAAVLPAAAEGAAYGGLYGAGEAKPGERLGGAATGAAIGGVAGGVLQGVGNAIATRSARKAAQAAVPAADDLKQASQALYKISELHNVRFKQPAVQRLGQNLKLAAGRVNDKLRPKTAGFVDDIDDLFSRDMSLEAFDEFRQMLNMEIRRATPDDARTLGSMKRILDNFADNVQPGQMSGGADGIPILKAAREQWARAKKTEVVERILDSADVRQGQFTQSGMANAIKTEMRQLYKSIQNGKVKGFTPEETALVRQMAKGGSSSTIVNLMAKFAPRGPMSIALGQILGSSVPGVGNIAVPMAGHFAGELADRAAVNAAQALRTGVATGAMPNVLPQITRRVTPAIPGLVAPSMGTGQSLVGSRAR